VGRPCMRGERSVYQSRKARDGADLLRRGAGACVHACGCDGDKTLEKVLDEVQSVRVCTVTILSNRMANFGWAHPNRFVSLAVF
jgi:hypothetical protein